MSDNTKIEWADHTFNPWEGCQKVGPGCDNCYAEARNARFNGGTAPNWGPGAPRRRTSPANWAKPRKWQAGAAAFYAAHGRRQRVFCASLADVFDNAVPDEWRADLFDLIVATPDLDWLLVTKRIGNAPSMLPSNPVFPNIWLGITVVNQAEADRDIPRLLATPAAKRFLSCEPLLGPVDLEPWLEWPDGGCELPDGRYFGCAGCDAEEPRCKCPRDRSYFEVTKGPRDASGCPEWVDADRITLDWIIAGGESGPNGRPMHPDWARSLRDQCQAAGVAFHFKQWGEWAPLDSQADWDCHGPADFPKCQHFTHLDFNFAKVGKAKAGRLLDGREWSEFPA